MYITTSIPYVNAQPHIGFALEAVQADVLARYYRLLGGPVRFQSGTDENALKNAQTAAQEGVPVAELVARNSAGFRALVETLNLSYDDFIRTSAEERHFAGVAKFWRACVAQGDIYKKRYGGLYCVGCERFYTEDELVEGKCPDHEARPELVEEENYFFRLSRYQDQLLTLIETNQLQIVPETRRNEVLSFVRRGLQDFSISRSRQRARGWGLPVPDDPSQVIYVWFDALLNYITGPGYAMNAPAYQQFWVNETHQVHLIGKDIIRFHAVYWPAMLLSAGVRLPSTIFVHGFLTINGRKISKSTGNVVYPGPLAAELGRDALRYYLLRKIPATADGDFSHAEFVQSYNADLADQLGNLVNRVLTMIERYQGGVVPRLGALDSVDDQLLELAIATRTQIQEEIEQFTLHKAIGAIWLLIAAANKYVIETEPWRLARQRTGEHKEATEAAARLATVLFTLTETLRLISCYLAPFLPDTAAAIAQRLGVALPTGGQFQTEVWDERLAGKRVQAGAILFPKQELG